MSGRFHRARDRRGGQVKPNTVVRMARQVGFEGYEDFRAPFREAIRKGAVSFPDRARWLQDVRKSGDLGGLYADMVEAAIRNLEETFAGIDAAALKARPRRSGTRATSSRSVSASTTPTHATSPISPPPAW
jgi:hypothetical protein